MAFVIAQIAGGLASVAAIFYHQQKRKENALLFNGLMNILAMIQYILLARYTGALIKFTNILRNIVLFVLHKKEKKTPLFVTVIVVAATVTGGLIGWDDWFSLLPILGVSSLTLALCQKNMTIIRCTNIFTLCCWVIYSFASGAYVGAIGVSIELISSITSVVRYDLLRKEKKQ